VAKKNGKLYLVGLGPGGSAHLTAAALSALAESGTIVGYTAYIDQAGDLLAGKDLVAMELGQELERATKAVDLAYAGHVVAVVSSGDAGVYGMSGPVFQVLTAKAWDGVNPDVETIPGVSAMQAAAALLGAPLVQDFCAISLSNLLTPWEAISQRLEAAAQGDFVIALYNPRSRSRHWQLLEARRILMEHRSGNTPVGIVRDAFRPGQQVTITNLVDLEQHYESIDMVTTVLIGNSTTYVHQGHMATPRGYRDAGNHADDPSSAPGLPA
jgi:precorrin-3B C17-methyltransferase